MQHWIEQSLSIIKPYTTKVEFDGINTRIRDEKELVFSQGVSELAVSRYFVENYPNGLLLPRGTKSKKDIDVSFISEGKRINIEVKTPNLSYEGSNEFTAEMLYKFPSSEERKRVICNVESGMGQSVNVAPNRISNAEKFINECANKFAESAEAGDVNIVIFSMLEPNGMDDYRIKVIEGLLKGYNSIHAVILSDVAMRHQRHQLNDNYGFENCFNYVMKNINSQSSITSEQLESALTCIPHNTGEANAWLARQNNQILPRLKWLKIYKENN